MRVGQEKNNFGGYPYGTNARIITSPKSVNPNLKGSGIPSLRPLVSEDAPGLLE